MFPNRPRRPMGPPMRTGNRGFQQPQRNPFFFGNSVRQSEQQTPSNIQAVMNMFKDEEGNMDIGKLLHTAEQLNDVYRQVSPMITKFRKK